MDGTLTIFRNKCDKQLSDKQIVELVTKRKTGLIKGFQGKNGDVYKRQQIASAKIPLSRMIRPALYWVMTGDDLSLIHIFHWVSVLWKPS